MIAAFETVVFSGDLPIQVERHDGSVSAAAHWHKEPELLYLIEGALSLTVSGRDCRLAADEVFFINAQASHSFTGEGRLLVVHLSDAYAKQFSFDVTSRSFELIKGSSAEDEIRSLLWQLSKTGKAGDYSELLQISLATDIFRVLLSECGGGQKHPVLTSAEVSKRSIKTAMEYIEQHYREPITLSSAAELSGIHPAYLSVRFKAVTGIEFKDYITQVRMQHALDALLRQGKSVEEAAAAGGFPSKRNFITKCKRLYNLSPLQLKAQQSEE